MGNAKESVVTNKKRVLCTVIIAAGVVALAVAAFVAPLHTAENLAAVVLRAILRGLLVLLATGLAAWSTALSSRRRRTGRRRH